jgi:hypothetical protein
VCGKGFVQKNHLIRHMKVCRYVGTASVERHSGTPL